MHDEECVLAKNQYLIAIWGWDNGPFKIIHALVTPYNPCNFVLVLNGLEERQNYKDLYGVTGA